MKTKFITPENLEKIRQKHALSVCNLDVLTSRINLEIPDEDLLNRVEKNLKCAKILQAVVDFLDGKNVAA